MTAVQNIGLPEARIILGQCATFLASAPKSNATKVSRTPTLSPASFAVGPWIAELVRLFAATPQGEGVAVDVDVMSAFSAAVERLRAAGWLIEEADVAWPEGTNETAFGAVNAAASALL